MIGEGVYLRTYLAPFSPWLDRTDVTDILVNRPGEVWIDGALLYDANDPKLRPVSDFELGQPGQSGWLAGEKSPYGIALDVQYPVCDPEALIAAGQAAMKGWQALGADGSGSSVHCCSSWPLVRLMRAMKFLLSISLGK